MKKVLFQGSATALVTPMDQDQKVNFEVLEDLIEFQIENGTDALVACGTTGESPTLSDSEKEQVIKFVVEKVNGRVPVIAGTGINNTRRALELSKMAESLGADSLLIVTPYYNKSSQTGLLKHFFYIADHVKTPIILYNVPQRTGCSILPETYLELSKHENIIATKEASGDISRAIKTRFLCGENLTLYSGNDDQILPMLSIGAKGVISVFSNICPKESHQLAESFFQGDIDTARNLQVRYINLIEALFADVNPVPIKEALKMIGFECGECRMPLCKIEPHAKEKLRNALLNHKLIKN